MKGLYLYCIREKNGPKISGWGIDGEGGVYVVPYRQIEAVVSEVDLEEFGSDEIQKKAEGNINWIKEKAQIHEKVIEKAMGLNADKTRTNADWTRTNADIQRKSAFSQRSSAICVSKANAYVPVIPMKFGAIFETRKKIEGAIKKYYFVFRKGLENLTGKQEWTVKVYLNRKILEEQVKKESLIVREKEKEIASAPEGMA